MVPRYAALVQDLGPDDVAVFKCGACGHTAELPPSALLRGLGLDRPPKYSTWNGDCGAGCATPKIRRRYRCRSRLLSRWRIVSLTKTTAGITNPASKYVASFSSDPMVFLSCVRLLCYVFASRVSNCVARNGTWHISESPLRCK
jgi:hypothetical protein